jgi:hypothetical protein
MTVDVAAAKLELEFGHLRREPSRANVLELLTAVARLELAAEMSAGERTAFEELVFREVCERLGVPACVIEEVRRLLRKCCRGVCGCVPWGRG